MFLSLPFRLKTRQTKLRDMDKRGGVKVLALKMESFQDEEKKKIN